jgi:hypothetical protein
MASIEYAESTRWTNLIYLSVILLSACSEPTNYADSSYVFRAVDSPGGGSTARIARVAGGGAAGWLFYDVYLSDNTSDAESELVFRGYGDCDVKVEWRSDQILSIQYVGGESCSVRSFHSPWNERQLARLRDATKLPNVEIVLERVTAADVAPLGASNISVERTREK